MSLQCMYALLKPQVIGPEEARAASGSQLRARRGPAPRCHRDRRLSCRRAFLVEQYCSVPDRAARIGRRGSNAPLAASYRSYKRGHGPGPGKGCTWCVRNICKYTSKVPQHLLATSHYTAELAK